jgi:hypothetical protein
MAVTAEDLHAKIQEGDFSGAVAMLKRNPMLTIEPEDGTLLLNNINALRKVSEDPERDAQDLCDTSVFLYKRLGRQGVLRGFGCVNDGEYPEDTSEVSPARLEELTGIPVSSLTPRQRATYWQLAGVALCLSEFFLGQNMGVDPLYTLIPATLGLLLADQLALRGAVFESIYQALFPQYKQKIIHHEAGHFLISYLLGVPVRGCITSAWEARKEPDIPGQAGTIFYDQRLADEISSGKVTRTSLDRMSVVVMAGIAAEALEFGRAEGGRADEEQLLSFLSLVQPPWNMLRVQVQ